MSVAVVMLDFVNFDVGVIVVVVVAVTAVVVTIAVIATVVVAANYVFCYVFLAVTPVLLLLWL